MKTYTCQRCGNRVETTCTKPVKWCPDCRQVVQQEQKAEWQRNHVEDVRARQRRRCKGNPRISRRAIEQIDTEVLSMPPGCGKFPYAAKCDASGMNRLMIAMILQAALDTKQPRQDGRYVPRVERMDASQWLQTTGREWLETLAPDMEFPV